MYGSAYTSKSILEHYDTEPTTGSKNLVDSGAIKQYVDSSDALINAKVDDMISRVANPFVFKGTVAALSNLPSSGNTVNDTYFVESEGFMYTWNGTSWDKTSTDVNNQLARDIATAYSGTKVYKAGELVLESNQVYVRKTDATAAEGTFTLANWTSTSLGNELYNLKSAVSDSTYIRPWEPSLQSGKYIRQDDGISANGDTYCRTNLLAGYKKYVGVSLDDPVYEYQISYYGDNGNITNGTGYKGYSGYKQGYQRIPSGALKIAVSFRRVDRTTLASSDITAILAVLKIASVTDEFLSTSYVASDAKITGDELSKEHKSSAKYLSQIGVEYFEQENLFFQGSLNTQTGQTETNDKNVRSEYFSSIYAYLKCPFDGYCRFYFYDALSYTGFAYCTDPIHFTQDDIIPIPQNEHPYFRILFTKADITDFTNSEIELINTNTKLFSNYKVDTTEIKCNKTIQLLYNKKLYGDQSNGTWTIIKGKKIISDGTSSDDTHFCRTQIMRTGGRNSIRIEIPSGFVSYFAFYTASPFGTSTFISRYRPRYTGEYLIDVPNNATLLIVTFFATDYRELSDNDINTVQNGFWMYDISNPKSTIYPLRETARSAFLDYMAETCEKLGMSNSVFYTPSGLEANNRSTPEDELKLAIAVAGNSKALDIWSTKDRSFYIGGANARTVSITNNVYGAEPQNAAYKLLGGKGGSLLSTEASGNGHDRKARIAIYEVNKNPVAISVMGSDNWIYNNIIPCTQDVCAMMEAKMRDLSVNWVTSNNTNLRAEPNIDSEVLIVLSNGTLLIVLGQSDGWTHCKVGTLEGYVSSQYVSSTMSGNLAHLISDGGGYAAIKIPTCAGAYLNSYSADELSSLDDSITENESTQYYPASTTKTLTMLCALNILPDLQEVITISSTDIAAGSGSAYQGGDKFLLEDALRIMMMESSNTIAEAISVFAGRKLLNNKYQRDGQSTL